MKKITKWRPDTCDCILAYEWDTDASDEERTHTISEVSHSCKYHDETTQDENVKKNNIFEKVLKENRGKNYAMNVFMEDDDYSEEFEDDEGETLRKFKTGKKPKWRFDENRTLVLTIKDKEKKMKPEDVQAYQHKVKEKIGTLDVEIIVE